MTNTPGYNHYKIQLKDALSKQSIINSGGTCFVAKAGTSQKETLTDKFGASVANPILMTAGLMDFCVPIADLTVDLYILAPGGQFVVLKGVSPSGLNEYEIETQAKRHTYVIPFNIADCVAATEQDTGFVLPTHAFVLNRLHGCGLNITTAETAGAKTMTVGTLSSQSGGSASEFINGSSTASLGLVIGTDGGGFSTNAPYATDANTAKNISYTLVTASVAAAGFIILPVQLS
jgi:hypothetical protein